MKTKKKLILGLAAASLCTFAPLPAFAGTYKDAAAAYKSGNYETAFPLYMPFAKAGDMQAQHIIASMYYHGRGTTQSYTEAAHWFRKLAEQGNVEGQYNLGVLYYGGQGVEKSYKDAAFWLKKAALQNNADALYTLGVMSSKGLGVRQSDRRAQHWYGKAARLGHEDAQKMVVQQQQTQASDRRVDARLKQIQETAQANAQQKHAPNGNASAQDHYDTAKKMGVLNKGTAENYLIAAKQGHAGAQFELGMLHRWGWGGAAESQEQALSWLNKAADQGHADAQYTLGDMHDGDNPHYAIALKRHGQAAAQNHAKAQYALGSLYYDGKGTPKSYTEALKWYHKAAAQNHSDALFALGEMYQYGYGTTQSTPKAKEHYRKADLAGHRFAKGALERLGAQ